MAAGGAGADGMLSASAHDLLLSPTVRLEFVEDPMQHSRDSVTTSSRELSPA